MALIQVNFMSETLMRTVPIQVILPVDKIAFPGMPARKEKPFKTLYLLHGIFGNYTDWATGTRVQRFAEEKNLAVVMPSGENSFYVDQEQGHNLFGEFVGRELVELTRRMFPLSRERKDTFIGGLSMGGYGALRNGLKYADTFGCITAFSSALITDGIEKRTDEVPFWIEGRSYAEAMFGNLEAVKESDKNPKWLVEKLLKEGKTLPQIFMACGNQDSLLAANIDMRDFLKDREVLLTWHQEDGAHEWDFWDRMLKRAIDWLPLEANGGGMNSGNVGL